MRRWPWSSLLLLCACQFVLGQAQPAANNPPPVSSYQGKVLFLRSLCGDIKLEYGFDGKLKGKCQVPVAFTLAAVSIKSIELKRNKLEITGDKMGVYFPDPTTTKDEASHQLHTVLLAEAFTMTIHAPSGGAPTQEDYAPSLRAVFAATYADLAPGGPPLEQAYAAAPHPRPDLELESEAKAYSPGHDGVSDPKLIYSIEPEYSEQARKARKSGTALVALIVGTDGLPANVHIVRGLGYGLDEEAVAAARKYRFKPAEKDGKPVPVRIMVEENFRIFP
jgi:TonB family protein